MGGPAIWIGIAWARRLGDDWSSLFFVLPAVVVAALIGFIVGARLALQRIQRSWASYRLILADDSITRLQDGYPNLTIRTSEISKITETEGRGLVVHSVTPRTYIGVPFALEGFSDVRSALAAMHAIETVSRARGKLRTALVLALGLSIPVAVFITFWSSNKYVVVMAGIPLCVGLLLNVVAVQRSKSIAIHTKRQSWLVILLILAAAARVIFVIANW